MTSRLMCGVLATYVIAQVIAAPSASAPPLEDFFDVNTALR